MCHPLSEVSFWRTCFCKGISPHYILSIKAEDFEDYCCPSIPINVRVDLILGIFLIFQVIVSRSASTWPDSTLDKISYAPKVPCTSTTSSRDFSSEITASSEPSSQFMRT